MRSLAAVLLAAAGLWIGAAPAAADESTGRIAIPHDDGTEREILVRATWGPKSGAVPGWGFARVTLQSDDTAPHAVRVDLGDWDGKVASTKSVRLEKEGRAVVWLPLLPGENSTLRVVADDHGSDVISAGRPDAPLSVLVVGPARRGVRGPQAAETLEEALRAEVPGGATFTFLSVADAPVDALPPTWTHLTAANLVVVDAAAPGLDDSAVQGLLLRYARAGGVLWIRGASALPAGPLAEAVRSKETSKGVRSGPLDFGRWIATDASLEDDDVRRVVHEWLGAPTSVNVNDLPGALPGELSTEDAIPGIGRVDVRLYFVILVAFAILVGPVAYLLLKRRRRLVAMLWVVPVTGTAFAAAILGYGLLSEGLATRGVASSISFLDQRTHEATCVASRTLYAAFAPGRLRPSPDTVLHAPSAMPSHESSWPTTHGGYSYRMRMSYFGEGPPEATFRLDADSETVTGSMFPSRTPTTFSTATCTRARERLRFKARQGGGYDVLAAEGFAPVAEPGAIVLRDAKGRFFVGDGPAGPCRAVEENAAVLALERLREVVGARTEPEADDDPARRVFGTFVVYGSGSPPPKDRSAWARRALGGESPARGGYVALTTRAPGFDDLGVEVEWKRARHVVVGLLAPDDVE